MKSKTKKVLKTCSMVALLVSSVAALGGCIQSQSIAATQHSSVSKADITKDVLKTVNSAFYKSFRGGDWYYQGAQQVNGSINAYIQIPEKLDMSQSNQKRYLRQAICPSADKVHLWRTLENVPLSVHIYTYNKKFTVFAKCENPLV